MLLPACVAEKPILVRDRVGPALSRAAGAGSAGSLVVYSALEPGAHFSSLPYRDYYTDYRLLDEKGILLQRIHNQDNTAPGNPKVLSLPSGNYEVVARANGNRWVTVPVEVLAGQQTTVHLDGGTGRRFGAPTNQVQAVRLPDGQYVGWRAAEPVDLGGPAAQARQPLGP